LKIYEKEKTRFAKSILFVEYQSSTTCTICNHLLAEKNLGRSFDWCVDWYFSCKTTLIFGLWI